jgi:hypothetical protein
MLEGVSFGQVMPRSVETLSPMPYRVRTSIHSDPSCRSTSMCSSNSRTSSGTLHAPRRVNVFFTPTGGTRTLVPGVDTAADCGAAPGWYWPEAPATDRVQLCPASCGLIDGAVELELGCLTIKG